MTTSSPNLPERATGQPRRKRGRRFQVRPVGIVYLGVCVFILIAMRNSGTNLLYFVFGLLIGAMAVSVLFPWLTLRKISAQRQFSEHVVAGEPADVVYTFTNGKRYWPTLAISFEEEHEDLLEAPRGVILTIRQRGSVAIPTQLIARQRGIMNLSRLRLSCAFPFGFLTRSIVLSRAQPMTVYPRIGMLNRHLALQYRESIETGTMTSNVRGGVDEFYGLREYRPGDNIRAIHWRSTARTRQLMIREMAANAPPQLIVVLNLRGVVSTTDAVEHEAIEKAIEIAASLICYGFFENFAVGLAIAGIDTVIPPAPHMGRDARADLLRRLAVLDAGAVDRERGIVYPNKLAGRAEWIVVTLHQSDRWQDLVSPAGAVGGSGGAGSGGRGNSGRVSNARGGQQTVLAVDAPDSPSWVHFLSAQETLRLLRSMARKPIKRGINQRPRFWATDGRMAP